MNYYIDTEFLEGPQKEKFPISLFRKETKPTIDLISIGIVSEDINEPAYGGEVLKEISYYAISKDFNLKEAWNRYDLEPMSSKRGIGDSRHKKVYWIRENVLKPIWRELIFKADECWGMSNKQTEVYYKGILTGAYDHHFTFKSLKALIKKYGKTNKEIAEEIKIFVANRPDNKTHKDILENEYLREKPTFYAYYADYDWVAFCWLFGKMIDLPKGFPMYCRDLKQILDEKQDFLIKKHSNIDVVKLKEYDAYPKQENEHNALDDARWNKKLHEFLKSI